MVRRSAFEAISGFDTGYRHIGEDADFCLRATAAGFDLAFCPDAEVSHYAEDTLPGLLKRSWIHG